MMLHHLPRQANQDMGEAMKFLITLEIDVVGPVIPPIITLSAVVPLVEPDKDLLGTLPSKPKGRTGLDKDLTDLIDFFRLHPDRPSVYVPKWDKDKAMLRPYVQAKGVARVREMLEAFLLQNTWGWNDNNFNANFVREQPMTVQGFIAAADRLDVLMDWDSEEVPYGKP